MEIVPEEVNKDKKIMVYMGPYIRDRAEGKYNDYVIYDENPKIDYKSYADLRNGDIHNIDLDESAEFERKNIILYIPSIGANYDSYLVNSLEIRKWFNEQLKTRNEGDVINELRRKYEKKTDVGKMKTIQSKCSHDIVVKVQHSDLDDDLDDIGNDEYICLMCNKYFNNPFDLNFDASFKNIIYFDAEEFDYLSDEDKVREAFDMFKKKREENQDLGDFEIVEIINKELKENKAKSLINKPKSTN